MDVAPLCQRLHEINS